MRALAKFPEENPDPVLRASATGAVLFANAAARAAGGLIAADGRNLAPELAAAAASAFRATTIGQASLVAGGRRFVFSLTPMAEEDCIILNGKEVAAEPRAGTDASDLARFTAENPSPMLRVAGDGAVLFATPAARALEGLTHDAGRRLVPQLAAKVAEASASRRITQAEFSNGLRLFSFAVTPVPGEAYVNLYGRDVTEEWRVQRDIKSLAKFPEESVHPVLRVDGLGGVLYANAAAKATPGLLAEDGKRLCGALATSAETAYATKRAVEAEFAAGARLLAYSFLPVAQESYVNVIARDMTAERRANHDAQRSMRLHETILAKLGSGIVTLDAEQRVISANPAALRLLGLDGETIDGRPLAELLPQDGWLFEAIAGLGDGAAPREWPEQTLTTAKGARRVARVTLVPLSDDGGARGTMLMAEEVSRAARLRAEMARSVPDPVIERLLTRDETALDGATLTATVVSATIRNGAALAATLDAKALLPLLDDHLRAMCETILDLGGTLDAAGSDGVCAVFGAPFAGAGDAERAVAAASALRLCCAALNARPQAAGKLDIGIGVDTGTVIAGRLGAARRRDYAVMGAPVSLAQRLSALGAQFGAGLLISAATRDALPGNSRLRELDLLRLSGLAEPVRVFEVLDHASEEGFPNLEAVLVAFQEGLALYRAREFDDAAKAFTEALRLNAEDRPSRLYLSRCWSLQAHPPAGDWQGVSELAG